MSIEKSLKRFRNKFNLTQADVARKTGITQQSYSQYENDVNPSIAVLIKISQAFNVSIDYLAGISNNPEINRLPSVNSAANNDTAENSVNEFELQISSEIYALKKRLSKLESHFNF